MMMGSSVTTGVETNVQTNIGCVLAALNEADSTNVALGTTRQMASRAHEQVLGS